jgi:hypothetical protein
MHVFMNSSSVSSIPPPFSLLAFYLQVLIPVRHVAPQRALTKKPLGSRMHTSDGQQDAVSHEKLDMCRTLDPLLSKSYFYWARCVELKGKSALASIRNELLSAYRTAVLKHDQIGQVNIFSGCLFRNSYKSMCITSGSCTYAGYLAEPASAQLSGVQPVRAGRYPHSQDHVPGGRRLKQSGATHACTQHSSSCQLCGACGC